jgi:capsular polysaccharide biosynthesis protein
MTTEPGAGPTLRSYTRLVRRRKWWIGGLTLLGLAAGIGLPLTQAQQYTATAQVLVQSAGPIALGQAQQQVSATEVQTMLQLVTGASVKQAVRGKLGSTPPVQATQVAQTNIIAITAIAAAPGAAARVANVYANEFVLSEQTAAIRSATSSESAMRAEIAADAKEIKRLRAGHHSVPQVNAVVNQEAVLQVQLSQLELSGASQAAPLTVVTPAVAPSSPSSTQVGRAPRAARGPDPGPGRRVPTGQPGRRGVG